MKLSDRVDLRRMLPVRIRTLMILNAVAGVAIAVVLSYKKPIVAGLLLLYDVTLLLLVMTLVVIVVSSPLVLVEYYLYRKKKGVFYQWTEAPSRPRREMIVRPQFRRRRPQEQDADVTNIVRTRLFHSTSEGDSVSRAALLLTVADKLARAGKREAARTCYRQILDRFGGEPEARVASRNLEPPTDAGRLISD